MVRVITFFLQEIIMKVQVCGSCGMLWSRELRTRADYLFVSKRANTEKKNIRKYVKLELEEIQNILNRCISEGEKKENQVQIRYDSDIGKKIRKVMKFQNIFDTNFYIFQPTNYPQLSGETKARVFDEDIESLEYTYRKIQEFRIFSPTGITEEDYFDQDGGDNLLESLSDSLSKLNS